MNGQLASPPWAIQPAAEETAAIAPEQAATEATEPEVTQPPVAAEETAATAPEQAPASPAEGKVTVTVPKAFKLQSDLGAVHEYKAGVQEMDREHAEHWYAKANGVEIYQPK